jgi:hypothetical protein
MKKPTRGHGDTGTRGFYRRLSASPRLRVIVAVVCVALAGCKSPFDRTRDASGGGALGFHSGGSLDVFVNELKTGGGAFTYPGGENQILSFNDQSNPFTARSIRYVWNGGDVSNPGCSAPEHIFAGFDLMHTPTLSTYAATPGRNLQPAGYHLVTFQARGNIPTTSAGVTILKVEVASDGAAAACTAPAPRPCIIFSASGTDDDVPATTCTKKQLTSTWASQTISGLTPSDLSNVKDFFKATFILIPAGGSNLPGPGGVVYFDKIQYVP